MKKYRIFLSEAFFSSSSLSPTQPNWHVEIGTASYVSSSSAAQMSLPFLSFLEDAGSLNLFPIGRGGGGKPGN